MGQKMSKMVKHVSKKAQKGKNCVQKGKTCFKQIIKNKKALNDKKR